MNTSVAAVTALVDMHFPNVHEGTGRLTILSLPAMGAIVHMADDPRMVRPGGTVSGPAMFKLADFAVYCAILGALGEPALQAVTTNMTINFLSRPQPGAMIATVNLLKVGRRLAIAEVALRSELREDLVAHATSTYALPPVAGGIRTPQ